MISHKSSHKSNTKKKYDNFMDGGKKSDKNKTTLRPVIKRGASNGLSFVGQFGALDCSIGSIFRDEFGKNLKIPKTGSSQCELGRALSVLIIDDSIIQRKLTMRTLGGLIDEVMWMVEGAENGECALNLMETSSSVPDVIIVDQYMETSGGQLLGHEVVAELRRNSAFDSAVIIGCTGSMQTAGPFFLEAGCDVVWSKPMPSKEEAHAQIMTLLEKRKNNSLKVESISTNNQSPFTLDASSAGFSSGVGKSPPLPSHPQSQSPAQTATTQQRPVFLQMQPSTDSENKAQSSYYVSGNSSGSVFQFGAPPSSSNNTAKSRATDTRNSIPREEVAEVTATLSNIVVTE